MTTHRLLPVLALCALSLTVTACAQKAEQPRDGYAAVGSCHTAVQEQFTTADSFSFSDEKPVAAGTNMWVVRGTVEGRGTGRFKNDYSCHVEFVPGGEPKVSVTLS